MKRSHSIRAYVVNLVVAVTLPLLALGAFLLIRSAHNVQQAIATTAHERAQAAAADLDRELRNLEDLISMVATSYYFVIGDFTAFHLDVLSILKDRSVGIFVRDVAGRAILNSCISDDLAFSMNNTLSKTLSSLAHNFGGRALISDLVVEPVSGEPLVTIDSLVWREDNSAYIISLCALPRVHRVLTEQHLPAGWTAMVVDRQGRTIAGITQAAGSSFASVGRDLSAAISASDQHSIGKLWSSFGSSYKASSPVDLAGWTVVVDVAGETLLGPVRRSLLVLLVAGGGTLALVLFLVVNIGGRIAGPLTRLTGIARALGSGRQVAPPCTGISEADLIAQVLCSTGQDLERRTAELTQTVEELRRGEKRLVNVSDDLQQALADRTELLNHIVSAQESERQRIARELHDHLGQYFAAMLLGLNAADKASGRRDERYRAIADLKEMTSAISREVHELSWELRPTALDDIGLEAAIANYLEKWSGRFDLKVDFVGNLRGKRLSPPVEITLYRVLQEAMTNVAKHADAERISVILDAGINEVRLVVEDDGTGYARRSESVHEASTGGFGLIGIRERLALVGGSLIIEPATDHGTALFCRIPA